MKKKIICVFLLICMLSPLLLSCGANESPADNNNAGTEQSAENAENTETAAVSEEDARAAVSDDLPEMDFNGYIFTVSTRENGQGSCEHIKDLVVEEETGDLLDDAVYHRTRTVEERFNVKIEAAAVDHDDGSGDTIRRSVLAGEQRYDMVIGHAVGLGNIVTSGVFYNWYDLPYTDFDKPWWVKNATEQLTVDGKSFFAVSDLSYNALDYTYCLLFNKRLFADYGIEIPYERVRNRRWTIDYLSQITKDLYIDLNNDGARDENDFYGYVSNTLSAGATYTFAFDNPITKKNNSGSFDMVFNNEKSASIIDKLYSFFWENEGSYLIYDWSPQYRGVSLWDFHWKIFSGGDAVIVTAMFVNAVKNLRDMEDDYGFLPFPLYDENQEKYQTYLDLHGTLMAAPANLENPERTGIIISALSAEGYKQVTPVYYDIALKTKFSRDEEAAEMIDIIMAGRTFDFGVQYDDFLGGSWYISNLLGNNASTNFASYIERHEIPLQRRYDRVIEFYQNYGN